MEGIFQKYLINKKTESNSTANITAPPKTDVKQDSETSVRIVDGDDNKPVMIKQKKKYIFCNSAFSKISNLVFKS